MLLLQSPIDSNRFITAWALLREYCYLGNEILGDTYCKTFRFKYFPVHLYLGITAFQYRAFPLIMDFPCDVFRLSRGILEVLDQAIDNMVKGVGIIVPKD